MEISHHQDRSGNTSQADPASLHRLSQLSGEQAIQRDGTRENAGE